MRLVYMRLVYMRLVYMRLVVVGVVVVGGGGGGGGGGVYLYCALISKGRHWSNYNRGFHNYNKLYKI